ncbi:MAG: glycosyltransferase family 2 protein [Leptolyngbyaceae cyanobacterium SM2_5_2]|nr:glycosyltransferase family 2 protein [Leptolyngbyaceae cyanobacterium SM2_5_2]
MAFSIVITTFNRLEWLKRAVDSALAQTLPAQVVIADNASTDGTQAYAKSLGKRVIYVRNATNLHHAGAVNAGVRAATGDWIKLLDDDDYLAPTCIEVMADAVARHPGAVICSCQAAQVDSGGSELSRTPSFGPGRMFYIPQAAIHYGMLLEQVPFGTPVQVAIRRDALVQSGGWDVTMTSCDDIDSWVRVAQYGDAVFINECLTYRTRWPGGYDQKIQLQQRLETNMLIKSRIHGCVSAAYRPQTPSLSALGQYLHLHWGLVALKQRQWSTALALGRPGLLSLSAWRLLLSARRQRQGQAGLVPKIVIMQ